MPAYGGHRKLLETDWVFSVHWLKSLLIVHHYTYYVVVFHEPQIPYLRMGFALEMLSALIPYGYSFPAMQT